MAKQTFTTGQVLTAAQVNSLQANDFNQTVSVKTANYTLAAADKGTRIEFNTSGSVTCTVNSGLFDAGDTLVIQNRGAGTATITAGTATVNTSASLALAQYSAGTLYFVSDSAALFFGDAAGISASIVDAKGDLIVGTADNTVARLAVGTNGHTLVADSTETTGIKWAAPAGGKVLQVVSANITTDTTITSTSYSDTNVTATITPSSTNSKILVLASMNCRISMTTNGEIGLGLKLLRGATTVADLSTASTRAFAIQATADGIPTLASTGFINYVYLDSPSTTSATTYKYQAALASTANTRTARFQIQDVPSTITLLEIGA
jgi:hypothetical protein